MKDKIYSSLKYLLLSISYLLIGTHTAVASSTDDFSVRIGPIKDGVMLESEATVVALDPLEYEQLKQSLHDLISNGCMANDDCYRNLDITSYQVFQEPDGQNAQKYYLSLRQPEALLQYYKILDPVFAHLDHNPASSLVDSLSAKNFVSRCSGIANTVGRDQLLEWYTAVGDINAYLPLLLSLGKDIQHLYNLTHNDRAEYYKGNLAIKFEAVNRGRFRAKTASISRGPNVKNSLPSSLRSQAANSTSFLPFSSKVRVHNKDSIESGPSKVEVHILQKSGWWDLPNEDFLNQTEFILYQNYLTDLVEAPPVTFVGFIDNEYANSFASTRGFYDKAVLGGNFFHGHYPHVIQLAQLSRAGMSKKLMPHLIGTCWGEMIDMANISNVDAFAGIGLEMNNGEQITFFDIPSGHSADSFQNILITRHFSKWLDHVITSQQDKSYQIAGKRLGLESADYNDLLQARDAIRVFETAVILNHSKEWDFIIDGYNEMVDASWYSKPVFTLHDYFFTGYTFPENTVLKHAQSKFNDHLREMGWIDLMEPTKSGWSNYLNEHITGSAWSPPPWPAAWRSILLQK
ncbi:MAG: hypothetical protein ACR2PX_29310 [Endozoicomonas sp.]|uniref:hypothetical protein n=1 Tax=Endozoicomonas sp. TaxID=1892382 RepID=UPI003D9AFD94